MSKTICKLCGKEIGNKGLTSHFKRIHNITSKEYYDKYLKEDGEGVCPICGKETAFIKFTKGYHTFCSPKCAGSSKDVLKLRQKTCLEKYGVDNPAKAEPVKEKLKQTNLKRYGVENVSASKPIRVKVKETFMKRYGVDNPAKSDVIKQRVKETNLKKFGVESPSQLPDIRKKIKEASLKKYGVEHPMQATQYTLPEGSNIDILPIDKGFKTKREKGLLGKSSLEKELAAKLKELYPDLKVQYKSDVYPFKCDFYIPSLDLYIEYNGIWTHGGHFFDKNNQDDLATLAFWESKNTKYYNNAINTWTVRDVLKLETAIKNNLNYIAWFNKEQAYDWINKMRVG